jgi:hypothetical protein
MGHGAHWNCVYDDIEVFVADELPDLVKTLGVILETEWTGPREPVEGVIPDRVLYLAEADGDLRHMLIVVRDDEGAQSALLSAYPFCCTGIVHEVKLTAVDEGPRRLEARLTGTISDSSEIVFFDALYGPNRATYEIGGTYSFRLGAIAYDVKQPDRDFIEITDPDRSLAVRRMIRAAGGTVGDGDGPLKLDLDGAAMMFPIEQWEAGDYSFYAPVKEIVPCRLGGRSIAGLQVTPLRLDGDDIDIVLYAGAHRLGEGLEPRTGIDVTGAFWLQGHLAD